MRRLVVSASPNYRSPAYRAVNQFLVVAWPKELYCGLLYPAERIDRHSRISTCKEFLRHVIHRQEATH
jgi:hypothetical protein